MYNTIGIEAREAIKWFESGDRKDLDGLHGYCGRYFPEGDPMRDITEELIEYWKKQFIGGRSGKFNKGLPVLKICGGAK